MSVDQFFSSRHHTEPQVRLRYSNQGTDSNLVSIQRSSSLPAPSISTTQSSIIPSDSQSSSPPFDSRNSPFSYHSPTQTSQEIPQEQQEHLVTSTGKKKSLYLVNSIYHFRYKETF